MKKTNRIIFSLRDHRTETYIHVRQLCTTLSCLLICVMIFCGTTALACPPLEDIPKEDDARPATCSAEGTTAPEDIGETAEDAAADESAWSVQAKVHIYVGEGLREWADDHTDLYKGIVDRYGRVPLALVLYRLDSALVLFTDGTYRFVELWNTEEIAEPVVTTKKPAVVWNYREIAEPAARA